MRKPEVEVNVKRVKNAGSGYSYTIKSEGFEARADFDPDSGVAEVEFHQANNMAAALGAVVETLMHEAHVWHTNPILPLRIDVHAGKFEKELTKVAPQLGFSGPQPAGEFGTTEQFVRFRKELPLAG